ncbi:MAG TPA: gamma-glutamyl-gamma-aminobutyrate hydrolase [Candidatus Omnitrophica bacterium]|nr:gamma-glutamyl-gamma-aminobutyrate hydrolase [Candidatus Omnitrophota bacterium]
MKVVLVSQRLVQNSGYQEIREALDVKWGDFLTQCGFLPVPVASKVPASEYFREFKPAGVLLTGGNDLAALAPDDALNAERDRVEMELLTEAVKSKVPVIGVCRGMQMLAHFNQGSLEKKLGHVVPSHPIRLQAGTRIAKIYGKAGLDVNSFHNYCVTGLGGEMRAAAFHADQTIEACEHAGKEIYGMMWHPERVEPYSADDIRFFKEVFSKK